MKYSFNRKEPKSFVADKHEKREYANFGTKKPVYDEILNCVRNNQPEVIFCDAPAGTGKTLIEKIIAARLRAPRNTITTRREGCDMCGKYRKIAALNLEGGWTSHSMIKLDEYLCHFRRQNDFDDQ